MIYNKTELKATIYLILVSLHKEILLIFTQNLKIHATFSGFATITELSKSTIAAWSIRRHNQKSTKIYLKALNFR